MATVTALEVSKLLLSWANRNGDLLTNLKLQKLLYYAQAWYLVNYDKPLFGDEIQAWDFGPVVPKVFNKFKKFKASPITYSECGNEEHAFTQEQLGFLTEFFNVFSGFSATQLVSMSHEEAPWKDAYRVKAYSVVDTEGMKSFYSKLYKDKHSRKV